MSNATHDLQRQHQASQEKYTYFMVAVAGACIAYAIEKAIGVPLTWHLSLLALSVIFWSASFYCGCKCANTVQALIRANASLLSLYAGDHESQPDTPELRADAIRGVRKAIDTNMTRAKLLNDWQFRFLLIGSVFFVCWRITEIVRVAPQP
jgi:hypothetical protein